MQVQKGQQGKIYSNLKAISFLDFIMFTSKTLDI